MHRDKLPHVAAGLSRCMSRLAQKKTPLAPARRQRGKTAPGVWEDRLEKHLRAQLQYARIVG
jgi:hypothetical protein